VNPKCIPAVALAMLAATTLAACGEKEEPATTGPVVPETTSSVTTTGGTTTTQPANDRAAIDAVVTDFLTKVDAPGACTELVTPAFVRRSYGSEKGCKAARKPSAMARSVTIKPATGGNADVVTARPMGGVFGGETLKVTLINLDGRWTINRITSNVKVGP
jgi:hypothetical protein